MIDEKRDTLKQDVFFLLGGIEMARRGLVELFGDASADSIKKSAQLIVWMRDDLQKLNDLLRDCNITEAE